MKEQETKPASDAFGSAVMLLVACCFNFALSSQGRVWSKEEEEETAAIGGSRGSANDLCFYYFLYSFYV